MSKATKTIVIYGKIQDDNNKWKEWLDYAKSLVSKLYNNGIYIGVKGESFSSSKISTYTKKYENRLINAFVDEKKFEFIELYSLPNYFKQAIFDFDIYISRVKNERASFVQVTIISDVFQELEFNFHLIKKELSNFIEAEKTIVFEMDVKELPLKYIMSKGKTSDQKTLKVLYEE